MNRRTFIGGATLLAMPSAARGQQAAKHYRIGMLEAIPAERNGANLTALRSALRSLGYVEGQNLTIVYRSADGRPERFDALADELVHLGVDLMVTRGTPAANAAKRTTVNVPVVMATMGDPGAIVTSFAHPGGNITGVTTFSTELTAKRLQLLKEIVPNLSRVALLHNMGNPASAPEWKEMQNAARALALEPRLLDVRNPDDVTRALDSAVRERIDAMVIGADGVTQSGMQAIVDALARHRLPASYPSREFVEAGGLMAYAINYPALYARLAVYIDSIFKGAKPGDLPIEQPSRFELVVNEKTAAALGLAIPRSMLMRADAVIH